MLKLKSTSSLFRVVNGRGSVRPAVPDSHLGLFIVDAFTCYLLVISHKSFIYLTSPCSFARKSTRLMIIVSTGLSCLSYSEPDKRNMMFSDNDGFISFLASTRTTLVGVWESLNLCVVRHLDPPTDAYIVPQNLAGDIEVASWCERRRLCTEQ